MAAPWIEPSRYCSRLSVTTGCIGFFPYVKYHAKTTSDSRVYWLAPCSLAENFTASTGHQPRNPIQALCRLHQLLPRPKQFDFDGILIHPCPVGEFLYRKPFDFLQHQ